MKNELKVGSRVKYIGRFCPWRDGAKLIVVKRGGGHWRSYFVVAEDDPPGAGSWVNSTNIRPLSPLEELGEQAP